MAEKIFVQGNEALANGAVYAGCKHFYGYPITPQNEITEWFARELPKRGGAFVQSESETASMNMVFGGAAAGVRVMTSTSSVGFALMQEAYSHACNAELPCVVVNVQRGGPGMGTTQHAQMDYLQATRGGGNGGYKNLVLAPNSIQENFDLTQLAFYLADKWRNPVLLLSDGIIGQMAEPLELKSIDFGPVPEKPWALRGKDLKNGRSDFVTCMQGMGPPQTYVGFLERLGKKWADMEKEELRFETFNTEDADLVMVAYGSSARVAKEAVIEGRAEGLKVGLLRPITVWPFPYQALKDLAVKGAKFLVVEDSLGQLIDDVKIGVQGQAEVELVGVLARHLPTAGGMIFPDKVLEKAKDMLGKAVAV